MHLLAPVPLRDRESVERQADVAQQCQSVRFPPPPEGRHSSVKRRSGLTTRDIEVASSAVSEHAETLLARSRSLYAEGDFPLACFVAMTVIEECGKLTLLKLEWWRLSQHPEVAPDESLVRHLYLEHTEKAVIAAGHALQINAAADRRHGIHPDSGLMRTGGVVLIARARRWMGLRNACLYTDIDRDAGNTRSPVDAVSPAHAYYCVCMAHEVLAEEVDERERTIEALDDFRRRFGKRTSIDDLDFLREPEVLRNEARRLGR
jgi:AbiV family abortive infection protein